MNVSRSRITSNAIRIGILLLIFGLWQALPAYGYISRFALPEFSAVALRLSSFINPLNPANFSPINGLYPSLEFTLTEFVIAFLITIAIGIPVGFFIGYNRTVRTIYEPVIWILQAFPLIALFPLILYVFGFVLPADVIFAVIISIIPLVVSVIQGVKSINPSYFRVARLLGSSSIQTFSKVAVPAMIPMIMSGIRLVLSFCLIGVVFGELQAGNSGVGYLVSYYTYKLQTVNEFSLVLIVIIISYTIVEAMRLIERRVAHNA